MTDQNGHIVVVVACSDHRLDAWFTAVKELAESRGGLVYRARTPGATILSGFFYWITLFLVKPFLEKGASIIVVQNHTDCAGMDWAFNKWSMRWIWKFMRIHSVEELAEWCMKRTDRHVRRAARRGHHRVTILCGTVTPGTTDIHPLLRNALD